MKLGTAFRVPMTGSESLAATDRLDAAVIEVYVLLVATILTQVQASPAMVEAALKGFEPRGAAGRPIRAPEGATWREERGVDQGPRWALQNDSGRVYAKVFLAGGRSPTWGYVLWDV